MLIKANLPAYSQSTRDRNPDGTYNRHVVDLLVGLLGAGFWNSHDSVLQTNFIAALDNPDTQKECIKDVKKALNYYRSPEIFKRFRPLLRLLKESKAYPEFAADVSNAFNVLAARGNVSSFFDCFAELNDRQDLLNAAVSQETFKQAARVDLSDRSTYSYYSRYDAIHSSPVFLEYFKDVIAENITAHVHAKQPNEVLEFIQSLGGRKHKEWESRSEWKNNKQFLSHVTPDTVADIAQLLEAQWEQDGKKPGYLLMPLLEAFEGLQGFAGITAQHLNSEINRTTACLQDIYSRSPNPTADEAVKLGRDEDEIEDARSRRNLVKLAHMSQTTPELTEAVLSPDTLKTIVSHVARPFDKEKRTGWMWDLELKLQLAAKAIETTVTAAQAHATQSTSIDGVHDESNRVASIITAAFAAAGINVTEPMLPELRAYANSVAKKIVPNNPTRQPA